MTKVTEQQNLNKTERRSTVVPKLPQVEGKSIYAINSPEAKQTFPDFDASKQTRSKSVSTQSYACFPPNGSMSRSNSISTPEPDLSSPEKFEEGACYDTQNSNAPSAFYGLDHENSASMSNMSLFSNLLFSKIIESHQKRFSKSEFCRCHSYNAYYTGNDNDMACCCSSVQFKGQKCKGHMGKLSAQTELI